MGWGASIHPSPLLLEQHSLIIVTAIDSGFGMAAALTSHSFSLPKLHCRRLPKRSTAVFSSFARNPTPPSPDANSAAKPSRLFFDLDIKIPERTKSLVPAINSQPASLFSLRRRKEPNTVFVAGATGQSGARIVLALLRRGFSVRAGVPDLASAQDLARLAAAYRTISPEESRRLNAVEVSLADSESIAKAIGPAGKAVITVGPGENGPEGDVTHEDALRSVRAAGIAGVGHLALVYDSRAGRQSTYNVLDGITAFFSNFLPGATRPLNLSNLLSKLVETDGVAYTLLKATLTDDYSPESSYTLVLDKENSSPGTTPIFSNSKVSKFQVAKLVAEVFSNTSLAENKVVEVSTSASASPKPVPELLSAIPVDGRRKAYAEALSKAKEEEEKARESEAAAKKLEEEVKKFAKRAAQSEDSLSEAGGSTIEDLLTKAKGLGEEFSWTKLSTQIATAVSPIPSNQNPRTQLASSRGQAKARVLPPKKALVKKQQQQQQASKPKPKPRQKQTEKGVKETEVEVRNVFGGLFKQETIYIDDD